MLVSTAELYWRARRAAKLGLTGTEHLGLDWPAVIARKNSLTGGSGDGTRQAIEKKGVTVLKGRGGFTGPHEIEAGGRSVTGDRFVIATGSSPARLPIEGIEHTINSNELLELRTLPERMVVIGGGAIGMELGFCMARAGTRVTVLEKANDLLPGVDDELRQALLDLGRADGMEFHTGVNIEHIASDRTVRAGGLLYRADVVLVAAGRPANTAQMGLALAGVEVERTAVKVNEYMQSVSAPHVYAAGDAAGPRQLTPLAWYGGTIAGHNAVKGNERRADFSILPSAAFTIPPLGQVGLTEEDARRQGLRYKVNRKKFANTAAAYTAGEDDGLVKVIYEEESDRILGVHVLGPHAGDLVQIASVAMRGSLTRAQLGAAHYVFPTLGSAVFDAMAGW